MRSSTISPLCKDVLKHFLGKRKKSERGGLKGRNIPKIERTSHRPFMALFRCIIPLWKRNGWCIHPWELQRPFYSRTKKVVQKRSKPNNVLRLETPKSSSISSILRCAVIKIYSKAHLKCVSKPDVLGCWDMMRSSANISVWVTFQSQSWISKGQGTFQHKWPIVWEGNERNRVEKEVGNGWTPFYAEMLTLCMTCFLDK